MLTPRCLAVIVKASSGPRYIVSYRPTLPVAKVSGTTLSDSLFHVYLPARCILNWLQLKAGVRVSLDMTTLTIMRILPREVDPMVSWRFGVPSLRCILMVVPRLGVQHVSGRPRLGIFCRYRRAERSGSRVARSHRVASDEPGAFRGESKHCAYWLEIISRLNPMLHT